MGTNIFHCRGAIELRPYNYTYSLLLTAPQAGKEPKKRFSNALVLSLHQLRQQRLELGEAGAHALDIVDDRFARVGD